MLAASAVLPIEGRPARITRSDGCRPPSFESRSRRPEETPARPPSRLKASAVICTAPVSASAKVWKPVDGPARLGQIVELLLGRLDLLLGGRFDVAGGFGGDLAAQADQLAAKRQVVDDPAVVCGVGGRGRAVDQVGKIAEAAQLVEGGIGLEPLHDDDGLGQHAAADVLLGYAVEPTVERLVKVARVQLVAQPLIGAVVEQDGAQKRLLGFQAVRGAGGNGGFGRADGGQVVSERHPDTLAPAETLRHATIRPFNRFRRSLYVPCVSPGRTSARDLGRVYQR
jgi:hypothetical protein